MSERKKLGGMRAAALLLVSVALQSLRADDARSILQEAERRHRTKTQEYAGDLTVTSKDGKVRKKAWRSWREGYAGDAKSLIRFSDPPEVRGVGFLSLGRPGKNPDQWLYLPSMKRERRIAAQDRDASFVGTDFNYEDMEEIDQSKYELRLEADATHDAQACFVVEGRPAAAAGRSIYERKLFFVRKDIRYVTRVDLFRKGDAGPSKRFLLGDVAEVDGHWVARRLEMTDYKKGSKTVVVLNALAFDRPQPADRFTLQNLTREGE